MVQFKMSPQEINFINQYGFMRKCRCCGETAYTYDELSKFLVKKRQLFGRSMDCYICSNYKRWLSRNQGKSKDEYTQFLEKKKKISKKLRVCRCCGLEVNKKEDLILFVKAKSKKNGTSNICLKCHNLQSIHRFKTDKCLHERKKESARKYSSKKQVKLLSRIRNHNNRALKRLSTPKWVNVEEIKKINDLHTQAYYLKEITGITYHIDHIYPSLHPLMCGLHTLNNLQLLEGEINMSKNNQLGYMWQFNVTELHKFVKTKTSKKRVFSMLGSKLSWEDFLIYEKLNYENLIYGKE